MPSRRRVDFTEKTKAIVSRWLSFAETQRLRNEFITTVAVDCGNTAPHRYRPCAVDLVRIHGHRAPVARSLSAPIGLLI
jgi:hypothetical protein